MERKLNHSSIHTDHGSLARCSVVVSLSGGVSPFSFIPAASYSELQSNQIEEGGKLTQGCNSTVGPGRLVRLRMLAVWRCSRLDCESASRGRAESIRYAPILNRATCMYVP